MKSSLPSALLLFYFILLKRCHARYTFVVEEKSNTRLCSTKNSLTVNRMFPRPTLYVQRVKTITVDVYNKGDYNITIHWIVYPFRKPDAKIQIILGEWCKKPVMEVFDEFQQKGADPNISDALLINGQPGDFFLYFRQVSTTFAIPTMDILQAYYKGILGVFGTRFPSFTPFTFNYTSDNLPAFLNTPKTGTEVKVLEYNSTVELVFQGTNVFAGTSHPMRLHGYSFYVVGLGLGNFNPEKDPRNFNLVDPPLQNTIAVLRSGWSAIRFRANNPGVWFMHCHIEKHASWGMETVFIVKNGGPPDTHLLPPPPDMPPC